MERKTSHCLVLEVCLKLLSSHDIWKNRQLEHLYISNEPVDTAPVNLPQIELSISGINLLIS